MPVDHVLVVETIIQDQEVISYVTLTSWRRSTQLRSRAGRLDEEADSAVRGLIDQLFDYLPPTAPGRHKRSADPGTSRPDDSGPVPGG